MFLLILERKKGRERERERARRERNISQLPPIPALTGDRTCDLDMWPDRDLNPQAFGVRDNAPSN